MAGPNSQLYLQCWLAVSIGAWLWVTGCGHWLCRVIAQSIMSTLPKRRFRQWVARYQRLPEIAISGIRTAPICFVQFLRRLNRTSQAFLAGVVVYCLYDVLFSEYWYNSDVYLDVFWWGAGRVDVTGFALQGHLWCIGWGYAPEILLACVSGLAIGYLKPKRRLRITASFALGLLLCSVLGDLLYMPFDFQPQLIFYRIVWCPVLFVFVYSAALLQRISTRPFSRR